jgi:hypothetical protein
LVVGGPFAGWMVDCWVGWIRWLFVSGLVVGGSVGCWLDDYWFSWLMDWWLVGLVSRLYVGGLVGCGLVVHILFNILLEKNLERSSLPVKSCKNLELCLKLKMIQKCNSKSFNQIEREKQYDFRSVQSLQII